MRSKPMLFTAIMFVVLWSTGCNTLGDVYKEVAKGGYVLWYPADSSVEAGQIWRVEGAQRLQEERKPASLQVVTAQVKFESLSRTVEAESTLDVGFSNKLLGKAAELGAQLKATGVKNVELQFGRTSVQRMILGDLRDPEVVSQFSPGYRDCLRKVQADDRDYLVIGAALQVAGMKYTFTCEDSAKLEAGAPEIAKVINADFKVHRTGKTTAIWEIPETVPLTIAFIPVFGKDLWRPTTYAYARAGPDMQPEAPPAPAEAPPEAPEALNKYQLLVNRLLSTSGRDAKITFEDLR